MAENSDLEELAKTIPEECIQVLCAILDGELIHRMASIDFPLKRNLRYTKSIIKKLYANNLVNFTYLSEEDTYKICGSGYWRNDRGNKLLELLNRYPEYN